MAADVASKEARTSGKTYVVASALQPSPAVSVFACDHPYAGNAGINIMYQFLPDGRRIPHENRPRRH
jgi:hypothetical protein